MKAFSLRTEDREESYGREIAYFFDKYPSGEYGFIVGNSKVFVYDDRDTCILDMIQNVKNHLLRHYGLPEED